MIQTLKNNLALILVGAVMLLAAAAVPLVASGVTHAADIQNSLCGGANSLQISDNNSASCNTVGTDTEGSLNRLITKIVNIFSLIVGVVAVIMIIIGGFRYITSGGDSNNVGAAKNTILYAIVGLIIVALAQVIVKFVLAKATATT
jgi:hypothetical protein